MILTDSSANWGSAQPHIAGTRVLPFGLPGCLIPSQIRYASKSPSNVCFDGGTGDSTETCQSC